MAQHRIIVRNLSGRALPFYAFQKQASFSGAGSAPSVLSSAIASGVLAPYADSGAQLLFAFDDQNFAAAVRNASPSDSGPGICRPGAPANRSVGKIIAARPIGIAAADSAQPAANFSTLSVSPLGLSAPEHKYSVPAGSFGIEIPSCPEEYLRQLYCGCAFVYQNEDVILSTYVLPLPQSELHCAPLPCFYVKIGSYAAGSPVPYDISQSACCDFTGGASKAFVYYNSDGSFKVFNDVQSTDEGECKWPLSMT